MKVFVILLIAILSSALAIQLISSDELEEYFTKYISEDLTNEENKKLQNAIEILRRPSFFKPNSYRTETRMTLDCLICRNVLRALFTGVENGQSEDDLIEAITIFCISLNIESENVCRGVITLNLPIFIYIIRNAPEATPNGFCALVLQNSYSNACPYEDLRFEWKVELPDPVQVSQVRNQNPTPLTAVIVTDAHIDPYYEPFGAANCGEPTCCRKGQTNKQRRQVFKPNIDEQIIEQSIIKDDDKIMLNLEFASTIRNMKSKSKTRVESFRNSEPAGFWGDYRDCDTPIWAYDDVVETIAEHKNIDVVYYIGDTIDHHVWETTYEMINETNAYLIDKMRKTFGDDILVIPAIGNHESQPTNQFAPPSVTEKYLTTAWLYKALADKWDFYLTEEAKSTLLERGEFSMLVRPGLRVISLNNNVAYRYNWWLVYDPQLPKNNLDWLTQELHKAELAGEKVHILTHIPAGANDLIYTWTREYNRIVNRFTSTIAAEFNGHTHSDEFRIFYSLEDGKAINVAWGGGSATTYSHYNLNYKIATINAVTYEPQSIVNYVYNLTEANLTPQRRPHWFQLYDMKNTFEIPDLSPESMNSLVHDMVTDKKHLLDLYSAFHSKISDNRWPYCDTECKLNNLCRTVVTVLWEREKCNELRTLFFLNHK